MTLSKLMTYLASTGKRAVNLSSLQWDGDVDGGILQRSQLDLGGQGLAAHKEKELRSTLGLADLTMDVREGGLRGGNLEGVGLVNSTNEKLHDADGSAKGRRQFC